jgi:hypothetical protein
LNKKFYFGIGLSSLPTSGRHDAKKLAEAKDLIDELQTEIGMDSELVKAKVLLKRMEIIGK